MGVGFFALGFRIGFWGWGWKGKGFFEGFGEWGGCLRGRRIVKRLVSGCWGWSGCLDGRDGWESPSAAENHEWSPQDVQYEWPERLHSP